MCVRDTAHPRLPLALKNAAEQRESAAGGRWAQSPSSQSKYLDILCRKGRAGGRETSRRMGGGGVTRSGGQRGWRKRAGVEGRRRRRWGEGGRAAGVDEESRYPRCRASPSRSPMLTALLIALPMARRTTDV